MSDITVLDRIVEEVRHIAAERPEHIYQPDPFITHCSYLTSNDEPGRGCIIGQAFERVGVSRENLASYEGASASAVVEKLDIPHSTRRDLRMLWLDRVQGEQDTGEAWADAVATADRTYPEVSR